jgi:hypothetical protein
MAHAAKPKPTKTLEQTLWKAADKLRGNQEPGECYAYPPDAEAKAIELVLETAELFAKEVASEG